jgi:hypothetical protein
MLERPPNRPGALRQAGVKFLNFLHERARPPGSFQLISERDALKNVLLLVPAFPL